MKRFDFTTYYARIEKAASDDEISAIRKEYDAFQNSLTEPERQQFKADFNQYLEKSIDRAKIEIALLKGIVTNAQPA